MISRLLWVAAIVAAALPIAHASAATRTFFAFHRYSNTNSYLTINRQDVYTGAILSQQGFRAGAGTSTDECAGGQGWLPGGWYDVVGHFDHYTGSKIQGRAWQLSDKRCYGGTGNPRMKPFIHSAETSGNGEDSTTPCGAHAWWGGDVGTSTTR